MPRANRYFIPGQIWHLTHRCHRGQFLLKFIRDRERYLLWLFRARQRHGLCVLNYMVASNHVHLLVRDTGPEVIARSMQLVAARTAQEFNRRKRRRGAFWEDRYHATAVESDHHFARCLVYVDLNMVRAGVVSHPSDWPHCGYQEIMGGRQRYSVVHKQELMCLTGVETEGQLRVTRENWVRFALDSGPPQREEQWTRSVAVGSAKFVEGIKGQLGSKAKARRICTDGHLSVLREPPCPYRAIYGPQKGL